MTTWISHKPLHASAPDRVAEVVLALGALDRDQGFRDAEGGIQRAAVVEALRGRFTRAGLLMAPPSYMDALDTSRGIGLRVEAGRAHTNNDGLLAVLQAARDPAVRALVLVVPMVYKNSPCANRVYGRLLELLSGPGIDLELDGVALVAY